MLSQFNNTILILSQFNESVLMLNQFDKSILMLSQFNDTISMLNQFYNTISMLNESVLINYVSFYISQRSSSSSLRLSNSITDFFTVFCFFEKTLIIFLICIMMNL